MHQEEKANEIHRDARNSMCEGLFERVAIKVNGHKKIYADDANKKDGPFYCEECLSDVIVRKCNEKKDHFAHKGRLSNLFSNSETQLHKDCKSEILFDLQKAFPDGKWATERPIPENKNMGHLNLVPDISGRINNQPIVIEVQRSYLNIKTIIKRTQEYTKRGVAILWIIPLKEDLGTDYFRPRLFEKFLHTMYFGKVYFWKAGYGAKVLPIHFGKAERYIEDSTWYDTEINEEVNVGGYWKLFKTVREPIAAPKLLDIRTDFLVEPAEEWKLKNEKLTVPKRLIFKDKITKWWTNEPSRK